MGWLDHAVHQDNVTIVNASIAHRGAADALQEGRQGCLSSDCCLHVSLVVAAHFSLILGSRTSLAALLFQSWKMGIQKACWPRLFN